MQKHIELCGCYFLTSSQCVLVDRSCCLLFMNLQLSDAMTWRIALYCIEGIQTVKRANMLFLFKIIAYRKTLQVDHVTRLT